MPMNGPVKTMDDMPGWPGANWSEGGDPSVNVNMQQQGHPMGNFNAQYGQPGAMDPSMPMNSVDAWNPAQQAGSRLAPTHKPGTSASTNSRRRK
eukprot:2126922-Pyramimonas_sp.AAC.3